MYDVLVPMFNMQHLFGVYTPAAQVLITGVVNGTEQELRDSLARLINTPDPRMSLLHLTWDKDAAFLKDYAAEVLGAGAADGLVCFRVSEPAECEGLRSKRVWVRGWEVGKHWG